jgi:serine/threonine protein kinase/Tol biopolymer transport system component
LLVFSGLEFLRVFTAFYNKLAALASYYRMIGQTLEQYRILEKLGAGGMGVVYRAHDELLKRDVAIKVLSADLVEAGRGNARFHREAQALAALNHPNIASIYGLEESASSVALIMELVEGPTLADKLLKGPVPLRQALEIARQIAHGLECAHEHGVVHRDLKPGNIKLREDGTVKVLDFGLAKFLDPESDRGGTEAAATVSDLTSKPGTLLGTLAYMSPEQARGNKVGLGADIWAFGVVLYEMLSGRRAFQGSTSSDVIAAIMTEDPDWGALPRHTPRPILRLLRRCLTKDPHDRLHAMTDARLEIEESLAAISSARKDSAAREPSSTSWWMPLLPWILLGLVVAMTALVLVRKWPGSRNASLRNAVRFSINLPSEAPLAPASAMPLAVGRPSLTLSPDGTNLVYVALVNGETRLYLRDMERAEFRPLAGTEGAHSPFFSPDGQWVGFFARDKLKKIALNGGQPVTLSDATLGFGGSWAPDGSIYFSTDYNSLIYKVASSGGLPQTIADTSSPFRLQFFPQILPENRGVLFSFGSFGFGVHDLRTQKKTIIRGRGSFPRYAPTGHILFANRNTLQAIPFDLAHLQVTGPPVLLVDGVRTERDGGAQFAFSDDGTLVYAPGGDGKVGSLVWLDRSGNKHPLGAPSGDYDAFRVSPDGRRVVIPMRDEVGTDIWLYDIERGNTTRLTSNHKSSLPIWSADGNFIYFLSWQTDVPAIFRKSLDSVGQEQMLISRSGMGYPQSISPDGKWLLFTVITPDTREDIWMLRLPTENETNIPTPEASPFLATNFSETLASVSPDGRWTAFTSDDTGGWEVYVCSFPHPGEKIRISTNGGEEPVLSHDGRELYYRYGTKWYVAEVTLGDHFAATRPRLLFEGPFANIPGLSYAAAPDSRHFLMVEEIDQTKTTTELDVVTNFFDELRRRVPGKGE